MKKLLFVVNVDWFFISHRLPIALAARRVGYEVHVATCLTDRLQELRSHGLAVHPLPLDRGATKAMGELRSLWHMQAVFRKVRPDIAHLVTVKPVVYGGAVARLLRVPGVLAAVPGLGYAFRATGWRAGATRGLLAALYRFALGKANLKAVFQNAHDRDVVLGMTSLERTQCVLAKGSGVDLQAFAPTALPAGKPVVMLAARLLSDKGIAEFVQAAQWLQDRGVAARFCLVGAPDPANRASIAPAVLQQWQASGIVELWGHRSDMAAVLAQAHVVVLPSYGEGMPKVLLEAAACARAVVTTDVPGCRDAIEPGKTGLLVPAADSQALAAAIGSLLRDPLRCAAMGLAGRALAEREFGVERVVDLHLALYRDLLEAA